MRLANIGHELQQALRYRQAWIAAENPWLGRVFAEVRSDLGAIVGPACVEAWNTAPVTTAAAMNLNGWGPPDVEPHMARFETALRFRFGWRRLPAAFRWHPGANPRPLPPGRTSTISTGDGASKDDSAGDDRGGGRPGNRPPRAPDGAPAAGYTT